MDLEPTAQALVTPPAEPAQAPVLDTQDDDSELDAAWERAQAEPEEGDAAQPEQEADAADEPAPTDVPVELKNAWGTLPKPTREALAKAHRDMASKLAEQGRLVQGIAPIRDSLVQAVREFPQLANMRPDQVAAEVFELARMSHNFAAKPVETMLGLIQKHNLGPQVAKALGAQLPEGAGESAVLRQQITQLEQQLQRIADPEGIKSTVEAVIQQRSTLDEVTQFASTAEHWGEVEDYMPQVIPLVQAKLGASASSRDVLAQAYDLALSIYLPDAKAKATAAVASQPAADPKKAEAVLKAKSVNVTSRATGQPRVLTEDELLDAAYDRAHRR